MNAVAEYHSPYTQAASGFPIQALDIKNANIKRVQVSALSQEVEVIAVMNATALKLFTNKGPKAQAYLLYNPLLNVSKVP